MQIIISKKDDSFTDEEKQSIMTFLSGSGTFNSMLFVHINDDNEDAMNRVFREMIQYKNVMLDIAKASDMMYEHTVYKSDGQEFIYLETYFEEI